ncbi:MAG: hypothetical protein QM765_08240 [Myxococcales bacterium]
MQATNLPASLAAVVRHRRFWTHWLGVAGAEDPDSTPYPQLAECQARLPVGGRHALVLSIDSWLSYLELGLSTDGGPAQTLGFDDGAHWHPHALRWTELDLFCRAIAAHDPSLPHPGVPLLLLARFAPLCDLDDANWALGLLAQAWRPFGDDVSLWLDRIDARGCGFGWRQSGERFVLEQSEDVRFEGRALYTLRSDDEETEFPFEDFAEALVDARTVASPPVPVARVAAPAPMQWFSLTLDYQRSALPSEAAKLIGDTLQAALAAHGLGSASVSGYTSDGVGRRLEASLTGQTRDPARAFRLIAEVLRGFGALEAVSFVRPEHATWAEATPPRFLNLARLELAHWGYGEQQGVRFDRVLLEAEDRDELAELFEVPGRQPGRWHSRSLADGGLVAVALGRADEPADGLSLTIERPSGAVAELILTLMSRFRLTLLPGLVVADAALASELNTSWPRVRLVRSVEELIAAVPSLAAGPQ